MAKYKFKIDSFRVVNNPFISGEVLERKLNEYAEDGWEIVNINYHAEFLCYQITLRKKVA